MLLMRPWKARSNIGCKLDCFCRPGSDASAEISAVLLSTSKAVLGTLDTLKREDYAIGLIAITLGVGAARLTGKVSSS